MQVNSLHDLLVFVLTFVCGQLIGLAFDFFRAIRKVFSLGTFAVAVQDILFCTIAFYSFSVTIGRFNNGDVRWFEFAGTFLGALLYFLLESSLFMKILTSVMSFFKKITHAICTMFKKIIAFILKPVNALKNMLAKPFLHIKSTFVQFHRKKSNKNG